MQQRNLKTTLTKLFEEHHLLTAGDILRVLETHGSKYNKTSVYRMLDQLVRDTVLCKHFFTNNEATYELRAHHHAHLVCSVCGTVTEAECQLIDIQQVGTFQVDHHHVTLLGTCEQCHSDKK